MQNPAINPIIYYYYKTYRLDIQNDSGNFRIKVNLLNKQLPYQQRFMVWFNRDQSFLLEMGLFLKEYPKCDLILINRTVSKARYLKDDFPVIKVDSDQYTIQYIYSKGNNSIELLNASDSSVFKKVWRRKIPYVEFGCEAVSEVKVKEFSEIFSFNFSIINVTGVLSQLQLVENEYIVESDESEVVSEITWDEIPVNNGIIQENFQNPFHPIKTLPEIGTQKQSFEDYSKSNISSGISVYYDQLEFHINQIEENINKFFTNLGIHDKSEVFILVVQLGTAFSTSMDCLTNKDNMLMYKGTSIMKRDYLLSFYENLPLNINFERLYLRKHSEQILNLFRSGLVKFPPHLAARYGISGPCIYMLADFLKVSSHLLTAEELSVLQKKRIPSKKKKIYNLNSLL